MTTPNRHIPYVPQGTLDPAAGLNESLDVVDAIMVPRVLRMDLTEPPESPANGDLYIVAGPATEAWEGLENYLVRYRSDGGFWQAYAPADVYLLLNEDDGGLYRWDASSSPGSWVVVTGLGVQARNEDSPALIIPGITELVVGDGLELTEPSAGVAKIEATGGGGGGSITVQDEDSPQTVVSPATTLVVGDGLELTEPSAGVAKIEATGGGGAHAPGLDLAQEILADAPHAYWKLDDAGATAEDSSINGRDLSFFGSPDLQFASVKPADHTDKAARFPSGRNGAGVGDSLGLSLPVNGDWTFECLVFPLAASGQIRLFNVGGDAGSATEANNEQIAVFLNSLEVQVFWENGAGSSNLVDSNITLQLGRAYHLAFRKNSTAKTVTFFINGVPAVTVGYTNEPTGGANSVASVGSPDFASSAHVGGIIGHAAFWTSQLSADRIAAHAAAAGIYAGAGAGYAAAAPVVDYADENLDATANNAGLYTRFSDDDATYTFGAGSPTYNVGAEYHGRYVGSGTLTLVEDSGFTINPPAGGSLVIPPGGTFTVKIIAADEADLMGVTEAAP